METILQLLLTFLLISLLCCYIHLKTSKTHKKSHCTVPQAPGAWPLTGHMHLFARQQLVHKTLADMADQCGPVFTIKLGSRRVLVVSDSEFAREIFTTHDRVFCDRPSDTASRLLCYNMAMFGFAPYGSYWREMKKIATLQLLSSRRIDLLKHIRVSEVKAAMKDLYEKSSKGKVLMVEMRQWFGDLTHNIALRMVAGKSYSGSHREGREAQRIQKALRDFAYLFSVFVVSDAIPSLGWLDFRGYEKDMKRTAKVFDDLTEGWLEEHKQKRVLSDGKGKEEQDFMDAMLNILEDTTISEFDADTIIKATCLNMVLAGRDTTATALTWALSLVLNNPNVLKKAQDELDINVGKDRLVDESDINNLPYLQSIVKETLRLYPPIPIIGLRAALEDCTLTRGYKVPAGTRLMVNVWKIQRDRLAWPDPDEFKPERFLDSEMDRDLRGQCFEFLPFGSGRRSCPGALLALQVVQFILASLLHGFEVGKPCGEDVDMSESPGLSLSNMKASPLQVLLSPRLGSKVYSE